MKQLIHFLYFLIPFGLFAQSDTEVVLFDLNIENGSIELSNFENISNNSGYDNQPSFLNDNRLFYASTRNGQTDIAQYFIKYSSKIWVNFTESSEYSPLNIPNKNEVSAVRLDKDGKQGLYAYDLSTGESYALIEDLIVAYYVWYDENTIVSAVIEDDMLNLYITDLRSSKNRKYATNVGRSIHRIPGSDLVSFISKSNPNQWQIKSLNPATGSVRTIANTIEDVEDMCWLNPKTLLSGKKNTLYKLTLQKDNYWKTVENLSSFGIFNITRITVNPVFNKLAMAVELVTEDNNEKTIDQVAGVKTDGGREVSSMIEAIVQQQLEAYNQRDIEGFMATYADDITLYNYPNQLTAQGKDQMRTAYTNLFKNAPDLNAIIKNRIVIGNKVIDEEEVRVNGKTLRAVAIYEIENGLIKKVTFIQ
ncbi:nuclear transport factor 2 family protein [Winogradskyella aurantia]|uniref:SnoaL-like domain-containing protein n=1 Tax=Winogradskyella aurantia TaxID=1915063 RepID=A0A265USN3_9FLAO|nr:nuclear transport factor 2 family protein [Winogradskyella aurantia]OZV68077.1 hypothetical protein CA834_10545 [Winogradskyella aurantia]